MSEVVTAGWYMLYSPDGSPERSTLSYTENPFDFVSILIAAVATGKLIGANYTLALIGKDRDQVCSIRPRFGIASLHIGANTVMATVRSSYTQHVGFIGSEGLKSAVDGLLYWALPAAANEYHAKYPETQGQPVASERFLHTYDPGHGPTTIAVKID